MFARITLLIALCAASIAAAQDSTPRSEFQGGAAGALPEGEFGLSVLWNRELGSGYSNVATAGGKAVTMFSAGEVDVVAAFEAESGAEAWRYELGPIYAGHDGSDDGPLSTPAISGDRVFALGPRGLLVALALEDGSEIWRRVLDESNSTPPFYGYTSSPLTTDRLVLLATGGDGHAVTAFDRATGETRWASGKDSVQYQSPRLLELGGRRVLVLASGQLVQGFDPQTGEIRFEHRHTEGEQTEESAHVIAADDESFIVKYDSGTARYRVRSAGLEEVWRGRTFGNSLAIPVLVGDHLYGFTGRFLTCADAATGEIVWRSRPPMGRGISLINGKLAVLAPSGELVLIEPSADGYRELTRVSTLETDGYATATFSDGVFLVRNLGRMAAVRADTSAVPLRAEADPAQRIGGELAAWAASVAALSEGERQAAVDARFTAATTSPFFEEGGETGGLAHFFWRGQAEDVGLEGDELGLQADNGFYRVPGTDLFLRSAELDPKAQYTYALSISYEQAIADPRNPRTVDNGFNVVSEARMPGWPASPHLDEPAAGAPRGELDRFQFRSEILDTAREIQVWRPAGWGTDIDARYPLLVVNHGDNLLRGSLMRNTLDNLVGKSVAPLVAVFVPRASGPEYGGPAVDDYGRFLVEELLPYLDRHYRTSGEPRAIMGPGSAGVTAVYLALRYPAVFRRAAAQSFYPIEPAHGSISERLGTVAARPETVYLVSSRHDYDFGDGNTAAEATRELAEKLRQAGVPLTHQLADYTPGWGGWRGQHDEVLAALFPLAAPPGH